MSLVNSFLQPRLAPTGLHRIHVLLCHAIVLNHSI